MKRAFKGIWIPREVWLDNRLTITDVCVLMEIDSLDQGEGCYASNAHLARFAGASTRTVERVVTKLVDCELLRRGETDGRRRKLHSVLSCRSRPDSAVGAHPTKLADRDKQEEKESSKTPRPDTKGFTDLWRRYAGEGAVLTPRDYALAKSVLEHQTLEQIEPWIATYFDQEWWFTKNGVRAFASFYTHLGEIAETLRASQPKVRKGVCPECGVSEGRHRESCSRVAKEF